MLLLLLLLLLPQPAFERQYDPPALQQHLIPGRHLLPVLLLQPLQLRHQGCHLLLQALHLDLRLLRRLNWSRRAVHSWPSRSALLASILPAAGGKTARCCIVSGNMCGRWRLCWLQLATCSLGIRSLCRRCAVLTAASSASGILRATNALAVLLLRTC